MVTNSYKRYLKSPAWQRKREEAFNYFGKKCFVCGTRRGPIQIHHLTYVRLGKEDIKRDLRPLCLKHHREVTAFHWKLGRRTDGRIVFAKFLILYQAKRRN